MIFEKHFTPLKATQTLPLVKQIVADILACGSKIMAMHDDDDPARRESEEYRDLAGRIDEHLNELNALGCSYKDWNFSLGLVDFPAIIDGEEVLLCWRSDETELKFYHGVNDGYAGRMPIPESLLTESEPPVSVPGTSSDRQDDTAVDSNRS